MLEQPAPPAARLRGRHEGLSHPAALSVSSESLLFCEIPAVKVGFELTAGSAAVTAASMVGLFGPLVAVGMALTAPGVLAATVVSLINATETQLVLYHPATGRDTAQSPRSEPISHPGGAQASTAVGSLSSAMALRRRTRFWELT
jgi:hypothetical protein